MKANYCQRVELVLITLIVILPFVWHPNFLSLFEVPKTIFFALLIDLTLLFSVAMGRIRFNLKKNKLWLIMASFVVLAWISSLVNSVISQSIWGNVLRNDGLWTLTHGFIFSTLVAQYYPRHSTLWRTAMLVPVILITIWAVAASILPPLDLPAARWDQGIALTLGNPAMLSGYLAPSLALLSLSWFLTYPLVLLFGYIFWINSSWGGLLTLLVWLCIKKAKLLLLLVPIMVAVPFIYNYEINNNILTRGQVEERRERIFMKAMIAIKQKPLLGWGWAQFDTAFASIDWPYHYEVDVKVDRTHSAIVEVAVAMGIPGLILYSLLVITAIKALGSSQNTGDRAIFALLILYLVHSQTNVTSIAEDIYFYLAVGVAMTANNLHEDNNCHTHHSV